MFINIKFDDSKLKGYVNKKEFDKYIEEKNIPQKQRINLFTKEEIDRISSILDNPLSVEEIKICCLEDKNVYKRDWFYGDDSESEKAKYNERYCASEGIGLYVVDKHKSYIVDSNLLFTITSDFETDVKYDVIGVLKDAPSLNKNHELKILDKLMNLDEKLSLFNKTQQFNTKVGVHISDLGLMNIKEVDVLYDACTDELQRWLDDGWRILAICPQPDSRRPDYVLGKNERMVTRKRREVNCR